MKEEDIGRVPDIYLTNQKLDNKAKLFREELEKWKSTASKMEESIEKLKKERDFHRMHHKRVGQEKNKLLSDLKKTKQTYEAYKPLAEDWQNKYEILRKEKVLLQLEKEKLQKRVAELEAGGGLPSQHSEREHSVRTTKPSPGKTSLSKTNTADTKKKITKEIGIPTENRPNPWLDRSIHSPNKLANNSSANSYRLNKSFKAHDAPISS